MILCRLSSIAEEFSRPVPVSKFCTHVKKLHADRDKLLEKEYTVNGNICNIVSAWQCMCMFALNSLLLIQPGIILFALSYQYSLCNLYISCEVVISFNKLYIVHKTVLTKCKLQCMHCPLQYVLFLNTEHLQRATAVHLCC